MAVDAQLPTQLAHRALESAPDAMIVSEACGIVMYANRQAGVLFGYTPVELIGRTIEILLPERYRATHVAHRSAYTLDPHTRPMGENLELLGLRQDGSEFPLEISLSPIEDGDRVLVAAAIRDASDRQRAASALMNARIEAERINLEKSRFLATASHDIRQPLQTLALLNAALRRLAANTPVMDILLQQEQAITSMEHLVNALLEISKLDAGVVRPQPTDFDVQELLETLQQEFSSIAREKGLELRVDSCSKRAYSDPLLVRQILRNLLANAIQYTHEGRVVLRCLNGAHGLQIEVLDTGIGIPAEQVADIGEEFHHVPPTEPTRRQGSRLGLAIVSRLIQLLDLRLEVHSTLGRGSSFRVELPASTNSDTYT